MTELLKIKHGSFSSYDDWIYFETGSWEDNNCPDSGHVYNILQREQNKPYMEVTKEEAAQLIASLESKRYFDNVENSTKQGWKGYLNRIKKSFINPLI